jgi:hypothetical protein
MFPLCHTCAQDGVQTEVCNHSESERELHGSWTTLELYAALDRGYILQSITEVSNV